MQSVPGKKNNENKLKTSKVTFKESLMGACTNIIYKLGVIGGLKRMPQLLKTANGASGCVIFGEYITDKMVAKQRLSKLIWFTYREKLKIAEDINSDVGWGCMPRVGQMMLAQALYRHLANKNQVSDQKLFLKIIQPFLDQTQESAGYSLSMILKYARWKFGITPGQWFNIGQLSEVLRKIQDDIPLKGTEDMKIVFFNQSVIFVNLMEQRAKINKCSCRTKKIFCADCQKSEDNPIENKEKKPVEKEKSEELVLTIEEYDSGCQKVLNSLPNQEPEQITEKQLCQKNWQIYDENNIEDKQQKREGEKKNEQKKKGNCHQNDILLKNSILLVVSVRIAEKTIEKFDVDPILSLLSLASSLGIIGGVPSKALYIVGYEGNQFIYLDPHYVQEHVDKSNYVEHLNTFFCPQYRTINIQALDPSMAFCFYLRTIQDVQALLVRIEQIKEVYEKSGKGFFISVMERNSYQQEIDCINRAFSDSPEEGKASFEYSSLQFRDISDSC